MQSSTTADRPNTAVRCGHGVWPVYLRSHMYTRMHTARSALLNKLMVGILWVKDLQTCVALMYLHVPPKRQLRQLALR